MPEKLDPIHILMRYSDKLHSVEDTIKEHKKLISAQGAVWLGKLGKTLGSVHIKRIDTQHIDKIPTYLYLVQRVGSGYGVYRGKIEAISRSRPKGEENLIPQYYVDRGIMKQVGVWFKLSKLETSTIEELKTLFIATSGMPVPDTLRSSMAALFLVKKFDRPNVR